MLLLLLIGTTAIAYVPLGALNTVSSFVISVIKAALVIGIFMRLDRGGPFLRVVAALGFVWVSLLICITLADYLTRVPLSAPW